MKPSKIQSAHDHFFRESISLIEIAKSLLFAFVKPVILKNIDFSSFEIYKDDWIDEKLVQIFFIYNRYEINTKTRILHHEKSL